MHLKNPNSMVKSLQHKNSKAFDEELFLTNNPAEKVTVEDNNIINPTQDGSRYSDLKQLHKNQQWRTSNEKDIKCSTCGKGFLQYYKLQIHNLIHVQETDNSSVESNSLQVQKVVDSHSKNLGSQTEIKDGSKLASRNHRLSYKFHVDLKDRQTCLQAQNINSIRWAAKKSKNSIEEASLCVSGPLRNNIGVFSGERILHEDEETAIVTKCPICRKKFVHYKLKIHFLIHNGKSQRRRNKQNNKNNGSEPSLNNATNRKSKSENGDTDASKRLDRFNNTTLNGEKETQSELKENNGTIKCCTTTRNHVPHDSSNPVVVLTQSPTDIKKKRHECGACGKMFSRNYDLKVHKRIHTGEKPYKCTICEKAFSSSSGLSVHLRSHDVQKANKCKVCKRRFTTKNQLDVHFRTHTGEKPYKCSTCKKTFSTMLDLENHIKVHTGVKPFKCNQCSMNFARISYLTAHMRSHKNPYVCLVCQREFTRLTLLNTHIRTHTGVKPYQCKTCGKAFTKASYLTQHKNSVGHTQHKLYTCKTCGEEFSRLCDLNVHTYREKHKGEKLFRCETCGKKFLKNAELCKHQETHIKLYKTLITEPSVVPFS